MMHIFLEEKLVVTLERRHIIVHGINMNARVAILYKYYVIKM